jgi:glyoxylate/hydroxypyruvate reductase A
MTAAWKTPAKSLQKESFVEDKKMYRVLIASYLEPEYVERIRRADRRLDVIYEPGLLAAPKYPADHYGVPERTPEQEAHWCALLGQADILFDFDYSHRQDLPALAPQLRWIQASSAGIGQFVKRYGYDARLPHTMITTSSGIHARPLAEFCIMAMLMHYKNALPMIRNQQRRQWERFAGTDLEGRTVAIVGLGHIGTEVAKMACSLGMKVIGTNAEPPPDCIDQFFSPERLHDMLPLADVLVLCVPHTPKTEKLIGKEELNLLRTGAYLINIARGAVIDEPALLEALRTGRLRGAALDVFNEEPLPESSPFWELENVMVNPHSASTSDRENERLTDLFCDNLHRFLKGEPLRNVLVPERYY